MFDCNIAHIVVADNLCVLVLIEWFHPGGIDFPVPRVKPLVPDV